MYQPRGEGCCECNDLGVCACVLVTIGKYGSTSYIGMTRKKNGGQ